MGARSTAWLQSEKLLRRLSATRTVNDSKDQNTNCHFRVLTNLIFGIYRAVTFVFNFTSWITFTLYLTSIRIYLFIHSDSFILNKQIAMKMLIEWWRQWKHPCDCLTVFVWNWLLVEKLSRANCDAKKQKSSTNSRSFKELLVNNSHKTSTSRGLTTTKILWRTSRVYHV